MGQIMPDGMPDFIPVKLTVKQSGTLHVVVQRPAFAWRCDECGWIGTGHASENQAVKEGADHLWREHQIAACYPDWYGGPHDWKHVKGSDALSECQRCHWVIGK